MLAFTGTKSALLDVWGPQFVLTSRMPTTSPCHWLITAPVVLTIMFFVAQQSRAGVDAATPLDERTTGGRRVLRVGTGHQLATPSAAAAIARDGDVIEIENGDYVQDVAVWPQHRLTLRGVGGRPRLVAQGASADEKGIWVLQGNDVVVENLEFVGARVADRNGAGIRFEGKNLEIRHSIFRGNENGLLATGSGDGRILVEHCEFADNGNGDGLSHNMYVGRAKTFILQFSFVHGAIDGHNVKSRARNTFVYYNRISDGYTGRTGYAIDLADAGNAVILGNLFQKSRLSLNPVFVAYGLESRRDPMDSLHIVNNTVVNDGLFIGRFVVGRKKGDRSRMVNNLFLGRISPQPTRMGLHNVNLSGVTPEEFARTGYRPRKRSAADSAGTVAGAFDGMPLSPRWEYAPIASKRPRIVRTPLDIGAFAVID